jgi:hypothetical protein
MKKIIVVILTIIIISACSPPKFQRPNCLTDDYNGFTLEWGYVDNKNNSITGYLLNEDGYILMFIQSTNQRKYDTICQVMPQQLCKVLILYRNESLKIPIVNEPGDELTFIKLDKPAIDYKANAIWNKFNTKASTGYRKVFDTLMSIVKLPKK